MKRARIISAIGAAAALVLATGMAPAFGQAALRSLDVYGSDQVVAEDFASNWGQDFELLAAALKSRDYQAYEDHRHRLTEIAGKTGVYSFVSVAVVEDWFPEYGIHVTIDLVDPVDEAERLNFSPQPTGSVADPEGLVEKWLEYEAAGRRIRDDEGMPTMSSCPAFHCVWGYSHFELVEFGDYFRTYVRRHENELVDVLRNDADEARRSAAVYLLAHGSSQRALIERLDVALVDQHPRVRTAALEILGSISDKRPDLVDPRRIARFLDAPTTAERTAALSTAASISGPHVNRGILLDTGGDHLVALLELEQPANGEAAYQLLQKLTGRSDLSRYSISLWQDLIDEIKVMSAETSADNN